MLNRINFTISKQKTFQINYAAIILYISRIIIIEFEFLSFFRLFLGAILLFS